MYLASVFTTIRELPPVPSLLLHIAISLVVAAGFGATSYCLETATFVVYRFLEYHGLIQRLVPEMPVTETNYKLATFKTFVGSLFLPVLAALYNIEMLVETARPDWNPLKIVPAVWMITLVHDWWFWLVHVVMHRSKLLYRKIHSQHHTSGGDLTVFVTADMHLIEAFFLSMGFYAALMCFWLWRGSWNPVLFATQVLVEASMNMGGHCGYRLPDWLQFLVTMGMGNTPWSATSTTHFIHHLDPRSNHALYFTWVDQLAGTYRATHPKIKQLSSAEWQEYNSRPWRLLKTYIANKAAALKQPKVGPMGFVLATGKH